MVASRVTRERASSPFARHRRVVRVLCGRRLCAKEARMSRTSKVALSVTAAVSVLVAGLLLLPYRSYAQAPAKRGVVLDNARVTVQRVTQPAGTIEKMHPHPEADYLSIQLTPGSME